MDYICAWETDSDTDNCESVCDCVNHPFYSPPTGRPHPQGESKDSNGEATLSENGKDLLDDPSEQELLDSPDENDVQNRSSFQKSNGDS